MVDWEYVGILTGGILATIGSFGSFLAFINGLFFHGLILCLILLLGVILIYYDYKPHNSAIKHGDKK